MLQLIQKTMMYVRRGRSIIYVPCAQQHCVRVKFVLLQNSNFKNVPRNSNTCWSSMRANRHKHFIFFTFHWTLTKF